MSVPYEVWFPEPSTPDPTYGRRAEHSLDWLARSTTARAKDCRRFLNEHLAKLPNEHQDYVKRNLRPRWQSAFFEIVVVRLLQEMGATIEVEQENSDGKRPDFIATFPDASVVVEANVPVFDASAGEEAKDHIPLLNFIEENIPEGWNVGVWELPKIGDADPKKEFKRVVKQMLDVPPPSPECQELELVEEISTGTIRLHLLAAKTKFDRLAWEAGLTVWDSSRERIRLALKRKRKQVRNSQFPVLLAIQASGISSDFEDFDMALFGHTYDRHDLSHRVVEIGFNADGDLVKDSGKEPTYAGVLAFLSVGFNACVSPVLYRNPRFQGELPEAILQLEQRLYDKAQNQIVSVHARNTDLIDKLNLVRV